MLNTLLLATALIGYLIATILIGLYIRNNNASPNTRTLTIASAVAALAVIAHLIYAYDVSLVGGSLNFSVNSMAVLVSGILVFIYMLGSLAMPIRRLGILMFPFTIASLIFGASWGNDMPASLNSNQGLAFNAHILVSIVAYSLLAIATIQALLYVYQERQINNRTSPAMLMALPPLQTMELLLFRLVGVGFALLTLTLLTGALFSQQLFGHALEFKHHTILAILGWCVFATLLFKRVKYGLRGSQAVIWTVAGFLLILLGYFGTKIVSEILAL